MSDRARYWRPKSYPHQSWPESAEDNLFTMSSPEKDEGVVSNLPQTIRAVADSKSTPKGRTLVICLDGTGDKFDNDNSNVVNFVACLKKDDPHQITYYQSGIGTYDGSGLKNGFSASLDMAVGSGLGIHIKDAYRFLMQNYREGDRICLLGFSRGAYTVRCLAGMLHKVGLLPAHNRAQVSFAYNFYKDDSKEGWKMSGEFKMTFCNNVEVFFVGVWDCVASVGFIPRKLPFSKTPTNTIHYFRHAMALDEHRAKFKICQFAQADPAAQSRAPTIDFGNVNGTKEEEGPLLKAVSSLKSCFGNKKQQRRKAWDQMSNSSSTSQIRNKTQEALMRKFELEDHGKHKHIDTDVLEVWFAGAHADVGGGAVANHERHMLSRIPLRWMIRQTFECNTGILFSAAALAETGLDVPTLWPEYKAPKPPVVGPSPDLVDQYEAGDLPPLRRRSNALGVERRASETTFTEIHKDKPRDLNDEKKSKPHVNGIKRSQTTDSTTRGDIFDPNVHKRKTHLASAAPGGCPRHPDLLPEQVEDHFDAIAPVNDMLVIAKGWWVLEFWPVKVRVQKKDSQVWEKVVRANRGRFRAIREIEPRMHWTVGCRMGESDYKIRNPVDREAVWQVAS